MLRGTLGGKMRQEGAHQTGDTVVWSRGGREPPKQEASQEAEKWVIARVQNT